MPNMCYKSWKRALTLFNRRGLAPRLWLTPHYQASALDYIIFGNVFAWNVGRVIYYNHKSTGLSAGPENKELWFESKNPHGSELRAAYFRDLQVQYDSERWSGQMFPMKSMVISTGKD